MHNRSISCRHAILTLAFLILLSGAFAARAQCTNVGTRFVGVPATNCILAPLSQQATNPICEIVNDGFPQAYWLVTISNAPSGYTLTNGTYRGWCADYDVIIEGGIQYKPIAYLSTMALPAHLANPNWSRVNYILNHKQGNAFDVQGAIWRFIGGPVSPFDPVFGTLTPAGSNMVSQAAAFGGGFVPSAGEVTAVILDVGPTNQLHFVEVACPAILDVCHGAGLTLCTTNTGSGPLTFMWFKDGVMIQGATSDCLALSTLAPADSGVYSVKVSNPCSAATNMVTLVISNTADTIPPVIVCASNRTFQCLAQVPPTPDLGAASATDDSGQVTVTLVSETLTTNGCAIRIVRRYQAADACGNVVTCDHTIMVSDTTAPTLSGVPGIDTYQCLADVPAPPVVTATDNCDTNLQVIRLSTTNGVCPLIIQHRWIVADRCGNSATNLQLITVRDTLQPTITCPPNLLVPNVASIPPRPATLAQFLSMSGTASDNCDLNLTYVCTDGPLSGGDCGGQLLRTHTVIDDCTNLMSCVQAINILTSAPPTIVCPPAITVQCPGDVPACPDSLPGFLAAGGSAAGNIVSYNCSDTLLIGGACGGSITRTHRVVGTCSNAVSCTQIITVHDTTPPVITCATNFAVECGAAWSFTPPTATDLCSGTNVVISILGTVTNAGSCPRNFSVTRTWRALDACTNLAVCSQTVTIADTTPPIIACAANATAECGNAWSFTPPTASDLCDGTNLTIQIVSTVTNTAGFCGRTFSATRTWRALDSCSNAATCSQTITVIDTIPPEITCAPDLIAECGTAWDFTPPAAGGLLAKKSKSRAALAGFTPPTAADVCDGTNVIIRVVETLTNFTGFCSPTYTAVRTWEAIDQCGNRSACAQRVTVVDTTPPTITCAADRVVECTSTWAFNPPTASDLCAGTNVVISIVSTETNVPNPRCPNLYSVTRIWRAADPCNNAATCSQTITTVDTTPPSLTCATNRIVECGSSWSFTPPFAADACEGTNVTIETVSTVTNAGPCGKTLTATRVWRAYDSCSNIATCGQSITVVDTRPPVLSCSADEIIECGSPWDFTRPFADDLCDGTNVTVAIVGTVTNNLCGRTLSATRTWRATDACGNMALCNQTVSIVDTRAPAITCAPNALIECGSPWAFTPPSVTDLCDGTNVVVSIVSTVTNTAAFCGNTFTVTRTWRATDSCTNVATCSQTITVIDTRPPQLTCAPDEIVECSQPWAFTEALAIDLCDGILPVSVVSTLTNAGSCPGNFSVTRTWRAVDACSNAATCSQTISITDTRPPTITCAPSEVVECSTQWVFTPPTATDLCDGTNVVIALVGTVTNAANPRCPNLMTITRTWRAADRCGNAAQCSQSITLVDTQPPTLTCAGNQIVECSTQWAFSPPTATDLCDGTNVAISIVGTVTNAANPRCPNLMSIVRTWRAADTCGNAAECSQTITLVDTQPPTLTCASDETVECGNAWAFTAPTATDLCDGTNVTIVIMGTVTNVANPRCPGLSSIVRTWRATDSCANAATCRQTINLVDTRPPTITCAQDRIVDCNSPWVFTPPTAADLCDGANVTVQIVSTVTNAGSCRGNFSVTRTWRALDSCSNAASCSQSVTVVDTTPPVLSCWPDRVVECGTAWSFNPPSAEDLCDLGAMTIEVVSTVTNAGSCPRNFSVIRTWRALDACSNAATCSQTITVLDTAPPSLTCAPDQVVECGDNWMFTPPFTVDACDGTNVTLTILNTETNVTSPRCPGLYSVKRTWRAADSCGNAATCSQTINVFDTRPPTLSCAGDRVLECGDMLMFDAPSAVDICDGTNLTIAVVSTLTNAATPRCPGLYSVKRTWRATDSCGNESTCSQTLNLVDTTAPTLVCAADRVIECGSMVMFNEPGAADACDGTNVTVSIVSTLTNAASPRCPGLYSVKRTWRATDTCGNESTCNQIISVVDTTPPTLTCAADRIIECGEMIMFNVPSAVDACDSTNIIIEIVGTITNAANPRCPGLYSVKRTWRATDTCGNESTCSQTISVADTRPPELTCARNEVIECGQPWNFTAPTATDICDGAITPTIVSTTTNAGCGRTLTAVRVWRATDSCGNAVTCSQTIRVVDTTPPALTCAPDRIIECGDMVMFNAPSAVDTCDSANVTMVIVSTITNAADPRCPGLYSVKRTWRATDSCGNESTCHQTVSVADTRPPELTCARNEVIECGQPWNFTAPTATDICDGTITPTIVSTTTNTACGRTLTATRTWRAADSCGNAATCSQTITVVDTTPPALNCAEDRAVECAFPWTFTPPTVRDLCDGTNVTLAIISTLTNNSACPNNYTAVRTWRATDTCGNVATCSQTIVVADTLPPSLVCAADRLVECGFPWAFSGPAANDLCDGTNFSLVIVSTVTNPPSVDCPNMFSVVRTWRATDRCGNSSQCTQTILEMDSTPPALACPSDRIIECGQPWAFGLPFADDLCDGTNLTVRIVSTTTNAHPSCPKAFTARRVWSAMDRCGNIAMCGQSITVVDTTPPDLTCADSFIIECGQPWEFSRPFANDVCDGTNVAIQVLGTVTNNLSPCGRTFSVTRTWRALDTCTNISMCSQTVTVVDTRPPTLICPQDRIVECGGSWAFSPPSATDVCAGTNITVRILGTVTNTAGFCGRTFSATRTWEAFDSCSVSTTGGVVVLNSNFDGTPAPASVITVGGLFDGWRVLTGDIDIVSSVTPAGPIGLCGPSHSGLNAVDIDGNNPGSMSTNIATVPGRTYVLSFAFTRNGVISQGATNLPRSAEVALLGVVTNIVSADPPSTCVNLFWRATNFTFVANSTTTTLRLRSLSVSGSGGIFFDTFQMMELGGVPVIGNRSTCSQTITIVDTQPPVLVCAPDRVVECGSSWNFNPPTATDLCDTNVMIRILNTTTNPLCGRTLNATRTWEAVDACGNRSTCAQTVTVADTQPPVITCAPDFTVECGQPWNFTPPTATDICSTNVNIQIVSTVTNTAGLRCPQILSVRRTWRATDGCGNAALCSQTVVILDTVAPVLLNVPANASFKCLAAVPPPALVGATDACDRNPTLHLTIRTNGACPTIITRIWQAHDACSNVVSATQTITVIEDAPVITAAPVNAAVCPGSNATFCVTATGDCGLTYQWSKDGVLIPGATDRCLTVSNAQSADAGRYCVIVRSPCHAVTNCANLTFLPNVEVGLIPAPLCLIMGTNISLCPPITASVPYTCAWYHNGVKLQSSGTNCCLEIPAFAAGMEGLYTLYVTGVCNVASSELTLPSPMIHCGPDGCDNRTVCEGGTFTICETIIVPMPGVNHAYQWFRGDNGVTNMLAGETNSCISRSNVTPADAGFYGLRVIATLNGGSVTQIFCGGTITVLRRTVASGPADQMVCAGTNVTFSVSPAGAGPFTYMWSKDGAMIPGQTNDSILILNAAPADMGLYCVKVTGACGSVTNCARLSLRSSVGDFVWEDLNFNGCQDANEPGISNVVVQLLDCAGANILRDTLTDGTGHYLFECVEPGDYRVRFFTPSAVWMFTTQTNPVCTAAGDSDAAMATGMTRCFTLPPGTSNLTLDAGMIRKACLGDFVWEDLNHNGRQDAGEPGIPDVPLVLIECATTNIVASTTTGPNGEYQFCGLIPGSYRIEILVPAGYAITVPNSGISDCDDSDAHPSTRLTDCIVLPPGANDLCVDIGLKRFSALGDFVWHDLNRDGRQDAGEPGISNVTVRLHDCATMNVIATQMTDSNGRYFFGGLTGGTYKVTFVAPPGLLFTSRDAMGVADHLDSDADPISGMTGCYPLPPGTTNLTVDAGLFPPLPPCLDVTKTVACLLPADQCGPFGETATGYRSATQNPAFCYSITISNCGGHTLTNLAVLDDKMGDLTTNFFASKLTTFAPGATLTRFYKMAWDVDTTNTVNASGRAVADGAQQVGDNDLAIAYVENASVTCQTTVFSQDDQDTSYTDGHVTLVDDGTAHEVTFMIVTCNNGDVDLANVTIRTPGMAALGCADPAPFDLPRGACRTNILCVKQLTCEMVPLSLTNHVTAAVDTRNNHCGYDLLGSNITTRSECHMEVQCGMPGSCRVTGGGRQEDSLPSVRYVTHGGQVGAPVGNAGFDPGTFEREGSECIHGNWQHVRHEKGGNRGNFHAKIYDSLMCACLGCPEDPLAGVVVGGLCNPDNRICGPEPRRAPANKICFSGIGDYTMTSGNRESRAVLFRVDIEDRSEPGNSHAGGSQAPHDRHRIRIWILTDAEKARLLNPNDRLLAMRQSISCSPGSTALQDGAVGANGLAVPLGTAVFGVRAPDIDDGGEMDHGNHQIHPMIKDCPK